MQIDRTADSLKEMLRQMASGNPDEAYEFAKWMTFSTAAYAAEAELARAAGSAVAFRFRQGIRNPG